MTEKSFYWCAGGMFLLGACFHLAAIIFDSPIIFFGWLLPKWLDGASFLIGGFLAYQAFKWAMTKK